MMLHVTFESFFFFLIKLGIIDRWIKFESTMKLPAKEMIHPKCPLCSAVFSALINVEFFENPMGSLSIDFHEKTVRTLKRDFFSF